MIPKTTDFSTVFLTGHSITDTHSTLRVGQQEWLGQQTTEENPEKYITKVGAGQKSLSIWRVYRAGSGSALENQGERSENDEIIIMVLHNPVYNMNKGDSN